MTQNSTPSKQPSATTIDNDSTSLTQKAREAKAKYGRQWTRLPAEAERENVMLERTNGESIPAIVDDYSFQGTKLTLPCDCGFAQGEEVRILYCGSWMKAIVSWAKQGHDGSWTAGFEWKKRTRKA